MKKIFKLTLKGKFHSEKTLQLAKDIRARNKSKGIFLAEFMKPDTTISAYVYCKTLTKLRKAIQNKL